MDNLSMALIVCQIHIALIVGGASTGIIIKSGDSIFDIIANFPALLFVNDLNSLIGIHVIKYLNVHKKGVSK
jgi:hypothetical protein